MPTDKTTEKTIKHITDLNEQIVEAAKKAGGMSLDAYERALESIAGYQEQASQHSDVEWISTVIDAQAKFTRELTKLVGTGRDLLK
jgi:hypothetical protein